MPLAEGTLLRWIDPAPGAKPLGIVIAPLNPGIARVLMADEQGGFDVEVFVARPGDTGVDAAAFVLERMEPAEDATFPAVAQLLRLVGPRWAEVSAHLEGAHRAEADPSCPACVGEARRGGAGPT